MGIVGISSPLYDSANDKYIVVVRGIKNIIRGQFRESIVKLFIFGKNVGNYNNVTRTQLGFFERGLNVRYLDQLLLIIIGIANNNNFSFIRSPRGKTTGQLNHIPHIILFHQFISPPLFHLPFNANAVLGKRDVNNIIVLKKRIRIQITVSNKLKKIYFAYTLTPTTQLNMPHGSTGNNATGACHRLSNPD